MAAGSSSTPLPPTVEEAYRRKCIDLRKRMEEVEQSNDAFRARKARLNRGIFKMRLERAYLLEMLSRRMKKNGGNIDGLPVYDEDSDGSSEGPPTPNVRPLRTKKSHRRGDYQSPPPGEYHISQQQYYPSPYHPHGHHEHLSPYAPVLNGHPSEYPRPEHIIVNQQQPPHILPSQHSLSSLQPPQPLHPHAVIRVPTAFDMFFENNYLSQPHKHSGARTEEDLQKLAHEHWESEKFSNQRRLYEVQADKQAKQYEETRRQYELVPEPHQQQQEHAPQIQPKREADEGDGGDDKTRRESVVLADQGYNNANTEDVEMADSGRPVEAAGFRAINE